MGAHDAVVTVLVLIALGLLWPMRWLLLFPVFVVVVYLLAR